MRPNRSYAICVLFVCAGLWGATSQASAQGSPARQVSRLPESGTRAKASESSAARRAAPYLTLAFTYAHAHGLEPALVLGVIEVESFFEPEAISHAGARGLMQLMPVIEREYQVTDVFDPEQNIEAGCAYLAHLLSAYQDRLSWALAAYNAGPGRVARAGGPPTHVYVRRVVRARARWRVRLDSPLGASPSAPLPPKTSSHRTSQ